MPERLKPRATLEEKKLLKVPGFLLDADACPCGLAESLRQFGYYVELASEVIPGSTDRRVLRWAVDRDLCIVTRNRGDFGALVFERGETMPVGVIEVRDQHPKPAALAHEIRAQRKLILGRFLVLTYDPVRGVYTHRFTNKTHPAGSTVRVEQTRRAA